MIGAPTFADLSALIVDESLYVRRIVRDMLQSVGIPRVTSERISGRLSLKIRTDLRVRTMS